MLTLVSVHLQPPPQSLDPRWAKKGKSKNSKCSEFIGEKTRRRERGEKHLQSKIAEAGLSIWLFIEHN